MTGLRNERNRMATFILVNDSLCLEQIQILLIDGISFTLKVRTVLPTDSCAFIPIEAKPAQSIINHLNRLIPFSAFIRILNP